MPLSWNEIKQRAVKFSENWKETQREEADAKPFLVDFFDVFGISNKRVASFEYKVKKLDESDGYIDSLWKGMILVEMKSRGKNLEKAFTQAKDYLPGLKEYELPKFILVCDFENFVLYDLEEFDFQNNQLIPIKFKISDLVNNVEHFGTLIGYQKRFYSEQDPVNVKAAQTMGKLHDQLREIGYEGHPLEVFLIRILFCLFAEDTSIFEKFQFQDYIEQRTNEDGSDLAPRLQEIFQVLNTPVDKRFKNLDIQLAAFPFVNGKLFEENIPTASFDSKMRQILLECCYIDWSRISPAIFGAMFQSIMNPVERRNLGAHYTSETNILKLINPLFLDDLYKQFEKVRKSKNKLLEFHKHLGELRFCDPACGSGNFLIIAYRELRKLELEILKELYKNQQVTNIEQIIWISIEQFYGIEIDEWASKIAEVAMWLVDHQMNVEISKTFGQYYVRLPLNTSAHIKLGNSLKIDWDSLLPGNEEIIKYNIKKKRKKPLKKFDFLMGNPPFIGKKEQNKKQKEDLTKITSKIKGGGVLDYVTGWFIKASQYIQGTKTRVAFISTNSISQGEQVGILWNELFNRYKIKIHFAHQTFKWSNEASGVAQVFIVIVGFANFDREDKYLFEYETVKSEPTKIEVKNINPYLVEGNDIVVLKQSQSICNASKVVYGSMPIDDGILIFNDDEKNDFLQNEPKAEKYFKQYIGGYEFINNVKRWCLWLTDIKPDELRKLPLIYERVKLLQKYRLQSKRQNTVELAQKPHLFGEIRQPETDYILIPKVSSGERKTVPIGFVSKDIIVNGSSLIIPNASLYYFGILTSSMHNIWLRYVGAYLGTGYQYSASIVYNNFPFPKEISDKQREKIEKLAQNILDIRKKYTESTLADLYDFVSMPADLIKAHNELDKAVDLVYRPQPFINERNRIEFLFDLYSQYVEPLQAEMNKKVKSRK